MRKRWMLAPAVLAVGLAAATIGALADSQFAAQVTGSRPWGEAQATRVTIRVEAGLDANQVFVPDGQNCSLTSTNPACQGGALVFSIENQSNVPLRVAGISQGSVGSCSALSDKREDGTFTFLTCSPSSTSPPSQSCALATIFVAPNFFTHPWPVIPPHGTLEVNGTDNSALGRGMIHLSNVTPSGCEGASFYIPLNITAFDATT